MHIKIQRDDLLKPLSHVTGIVEKRQTLPILSNLLLSCDNQQLVVTGTDLEIEIIVKLTVQEQKQGGQITLPARKFLDICRALPATAIIELIADGNKVTVKSGKSRFVLTTMAAQDFPNIEASSWEIEFDLAQAALRKIIERTHFSMAHQDVRYYLNGLLLEISENNIRAVATDGHRMAISELQQDINIPGKRQVIIPRKGIHELVRFLEDADSTMKVLVSTNHFRIVLPSLTFTTKLIDGRFPDYHQVIPSTLNKQVLLDKNSFKESLNRVSILSNEKYRGIRLSLAPSALVITAHNPEQEEAYEEIEAQYDGEEMEIGFNANYINEAVSALMTDTVELGLNDASTSGVLKSPGDNQTQYVVMPMRL